jgi:hypothetical protein
MCGSIDKKLEELNKSNYRGFFEYISSTSSFSSISSSHFKNLAIKRKYGIYVVRLQSNREVLYVGKSGSLDKQGRYKDQDIPSRLNNTKGKMSANEWFARIVNEKGPLIIEYIFLEPSPESPALVEAILLQAYLNENGCLPYLNNGF